MKSGIDGNMSHSLKSQTAMREETDSNTVGFVAKGFPVAVSDMRSSILSPFPVSSPFSVSVDSPGWSLMKPPINFLSLLLRFFAFVFSFSSALSLVILPSQNSHGYASFYPSNFTESPELLYSFAVIMIAFAYSLFQLFKGILEISDRGVFMSDVVSDYTTFILDQVLVYLLVSSSSAAIPAIKTIGESSPLHKASIISVTFSFATFLVIAICALLSGYKLCKRIIW